MIKEIKRNDSRWFLPYDIDKHYFTDEFALELVNSKERKLIVNGHIIVSTVKSDLNWVYDVFSSVRVKQGKINSITFYGIEYATNYNDYRYKREYFKKAGSPQDVKLLKIEGLINGDYTIDYVLQTKKEDEEFLRKVCKRHNNKINNNSNLTKIKKTALSKLIDKKLNEYPQIKDSSGNTLYIYDGVVYKRHQILQLNHKTLIRKTYQLW